MYLVWRILGAVLIVIGGVIGLCVREYVASRLVVLFPMSAASATNMVMAFACGLMLCGIFLITPLGDRPEAT